jgi:choline dehydrogenase-like flavoprotein
VTDPWGRVFGTDNLYVADSSLFPSAAGINPSWTIMALSRRVGMGLAAAK